MCPLLAHATRPRCSVSADVISHKLLRMCKINSYRQNHGQGWTVVLQLRGAASHRRRMGHHSRFINRLEWQWVRFLLARVPPQVPWHP